MTNPLYKLPAEFTPESKIIRKFAEAIAYEIDDQVHDWIDDIPEFGAIIPIHLEDEELDQAIEQVTSQLEELVYKALASISGIKI